MNVPYSKEALTLLEILYNENYLDFLYTKNHRIYFKVKYTNGIPIIKKVSFFSKKGQSKSMTYRMLLGSYDFYHKQALFNTPDGLQVDTFIKRSGQGGFIVFFIKV